MARRKYTDISRPTFSLDFSRPTFSLDLDQLQHRASQAAATTLTAFARASLARTGDYDRRAALPSPRATAVNSKLTEVPSDSSASSSSTSSPDLPSAPTSASSIATQAAAPTLTAFARAALARAGDISDRTAALPPCPRALASNYKLPAAPQDASVSSTSIKPADPPRAAPPGSSCKPKPKPKPKPR